MGLASAKPLDFSGEGVLASMRKNYHFTDTHDHQRARELRAQASTPEQRLWTSLRKASATTALKFRRQQPIPPYIVDFACMKAKLVIELDGHSHDTTQKYDEKRDDYLRQYGYTVMRFSNQSVADNLSGVVEVIVMRAQEILNSSTPSPANSKDLAKAKPKNSLPLPQGERTQARKMVAS